MGGAAARTAIQFVVLMVFWLALSGRLEAKYIILGAIGVSLVLWRGSDLFQSRPTAATSEPGSLLRGFKSTLGLLRYLPWLFLAIIKSNLYVAYLVVHPRLPIDPVLLRFSTTLGSDVSQVLLAHSITLTPGTITVDVQDGRFLVHAITPDSAGDLLSENMQNRVARVFGFPPHEEEGASISREVRDGRP